jgi:hypothetical protein
MQQQPQHRENARDAPSEPGLFALTAHGEFIALPRITTSPTDHQGRVKRPGPGHADAYSIYEPYPWNESTDKAFGSHYATHSHVVVSPSGHGYVCVASVAPNPLPQETILFPDPYYGWTTERLPKKVQTVLEKWIGGPGAKLSHHSSLALTSSTRQAPYQWHGLLFFKVPGTLAFSSNVNLSPKEIQEWKQRFEAI